MYSKSTRCKDCDSLLWSAYAKESGICPDCETSDNDILQDLEERLQDAID